MTSRDFKKAFTQLNNKPAKKEKYMKHNKPKKRSCGRYGDDKKCVFTMNTRGVITLPDGTRVSRRYFRLNAQKFGFKKLD